jgi:hypothetical protein
LRMIWEREKLSIVVEASSTVIPAEAARAKARRRRA